LHEGTYTVQASVKNGYGAAGAALASATFAITSRVTGRSPVVSATANPLVVLFSAPACAGGDLVVQYRPANGSSSWQSTPAQVCNAQQSINVLVAGMRPSTRYILQDVVTRGKTKQTSAPLTVTTGTPPAGLQIATFTVQQAPTAQADQTMPVIFHALNPTPSPTLANPLATDLSGHLIWYYDTPRSGLKAIWPVHILTGGTVLLFGRDQYRSTGDNVFREVDLAGDVVRETSIDAVNAQLARRGQPPIYMFHHDAFSLPDGDVAVLGATQKTVNGHDIMGDMVIVLDANLQVVWTWNTFDHLTPPARFPAGAAVCANTGPTLCALPDSQALDWTHANSIGWSPPDDDLTVSLRNLSSLVKIDFRNGHGNGAIIWRLGEGGDFSLRSTDPSPWFSHQHDAHLVDADTVIAFDNSNSRCQDSDESGCQSRGQVYHLDEQQHSAMLQFRANLGAFWQALGSAQLLPHGNLTFAGGYAPPSKEVEFQPNGTKVYELDSPLAEYRAYRLAGLGF
jgi:hypothetical protein